MTYTPLDLVENYLRRFVAYPSEHALVAHALWITHTHLMTCFETTPRLAFMSAEKASGKTRALEVTGLLAANPIQSLNATPAVIVRLVDQQSATILHDEIDAIFGTTRAREQNADVCALLNGGYRKGALFHRCTMIGKKIEPEALNAYAPVALAGLRDLPDTLASRAIIIRMRRRAPEERLEPFRYRYAEPEAKPIKEGLVEWCAEHEAELIVAEPDLPDSIQDRAAECWEPLVAIADVAGNDWPARARAAAEFFVGANVEEAATPGVELLAHCREAFGDADKIATAVLLDRLRDREESPWKDVRGKPLDDRGLAKRLKPYGIRSTKIRFGDRALQGYEASSFADDWRRYLPERNSRNSRNNIDNENNYVPDVPAVPATCPRGSEVDAPEPGSFEPEEDDLELLDRRGAA